MRFLLEAATSQPCLRIAGPFHLHAWKLSGPAKGDAGLLPPYPKLTYFTTSQACYCSLYAGQSGALWTAHMNSASDVIDVLMPGQFKAARLILLTDICVLVIFQLISSDVRIKASRNVIVRPSGPR